MTTKLTLLFLLAVPLFAVSPPVEKPGDGPTIYLATQSATATTIEATVKPDASFANGWMASYIDGWTIHEFHRRADGLEDDGDQVALDKIWGEVKAQAADLEAQWATLTAEQKIAQVGTPFWKRNVGLPRRLSRGQKKQFVEALSK